MPDSDATPPAEVPDWQEFYSIVNDLLDDQELEQHRQEFLARCLTQFPVCRQAYAEMVTLHGALLDHFDSGFPLPASVNTEVQVSEPEAWRFSQRPIWFGIAMAASLLTLFLIFQWSANPRWDMTTASGQMQFQPTYIGTNHTAIDAYPFAQVDQAQNVIWLSSGETPLGTRLPAGRLSLTQGQLRFTMAQGTQIHLQGPCDLDLVDPHTLRLHSGICRVEVSPLDRQFKVETHLADIVDKGTIFQAKLIKDRLEIFCREGQVNVQNIAHGGGRFVMNAGQSCLVDKNQSQLDLTPLNWEDLKLSEPEGDRPQFSLWSFEESTISEARNRWDFPNHGTSPIPLQTEISGQLAAPTISHLEPGVFRNGYQFQSENDALNSGDRLTMSQPPMTVSFWVKLFGGMDDPASLIQGLGANHNAPIWSVQYLPNPDRQFGILGQLEFSVLGYRVVPNQRLEPERWYHVTLVYFGTGSQETLQDIRVYYNGLPQLYKIQQEGLQAKLGLLPPFQLRLGGLGSNGGNNDPFVGAMDEVYIFESTLTAWQIQDLYQRNQPPTRTIPTRSFPDTPSLLGQ